MLDSEGRLITESKCDKKIKTNRDDQELENNFPELSVSPKEYIASKLLHHKKVFHPLAL